MTNSEPGHSLHTYGIAADCCFTGKDPYLEANPAADELWAVYGAMAAGNGLTWGGNFSEFQDKPHVEIKYGALSLNELRGLHMLGGLLAVFKKMDSLLKPG